MKPTLQTHRFLETQAERRRVVFFWELSIHDVDIYARIFSEIIYCAVWMCEHQDWWRANIRTQTHKPTNAQTCKHAKALKRKRANANASCKRPEIRRLDFSRYPTRACTPERVMASCKHRNYSNVGVLAFWCAVRWGIVQAWIIPCQRS